MQSPFRHPAISLIILAALVIALGGALALSRLPSQSETQRHVDTPTKQSNERTDSSHSSTASTVLTTEKAPLGQAPTDTVTAPVSATIPPQPPVTSPAPKDSSPPAPSGSTADALANAHRTGDRPEATSPLIAPPPFDAEAYARDPAPYLAQSVPGRVFQTAEPGPGVPVLGARGPATHEIPHGGTCDLTVRAPAGSAVSFTTFDLGLFPNGLASITVQATADGVATARFTAHGEVIGDVHVLAGSPQASGQVKFLVSVLPARPVATTTP